MISERKTGRHLDGEDGEDEGRGQDGKGAIFRPVG